MKVIEGMVPPGGWAFLQDGAHRIEAATYRDLLVAVLDWRLANNKIVGNVQLDVDTWICQKWPSQCQLGHPAPTMRARTPSAPTKTDALTQWALGLQGKKGVGDLVLDAEANSRAAECLGCPENVPVKHGCGSCHNNLDRLLTLLRRGKDHPQWKKLNLCRVSDQDTRTAIWIRKELLKKTGSGPSTCWLR